MGLKWGLSVFGIYKTYTDRYLLCYRGRCCVLILCMYVGTILDLGTDSSGLSMAFVPEQNIWNWTRSFLREDTHVWCGLFTSLAFSQIRRSQRYPVCNTQLNVSLCWSHPSDLVIPWIHIFQLNGHFKAESLVLTFMYWK